MVHGELQMLNDWNDREVKRAETTWGHKFPQYTEDMYDFALANGKSFLDLGCGFGRFLQWLTKRRDDPDYIGYDSSPSMLNRILERYPEYILQIFNHNVTDRITHFQDVVVSSAVFVHITLDDQQKILSNILKLNPLPKAITFDINSPSEHEINRLKIKQSIHYERQIKTTKDGSSTFRMTWQSHHAMTACLLNKFIDYNLTTKFYDLRSGQHKVVYMLIRKGV